MRRDRSGKHDRGRAEHLHDVADDVLIIVVLSSRAPHVDVVRKRLQGKAQLLRTSRIWQKLMASADLAIGASGSTAYERAVVGLPSILVTLADNQRGIARRMTEGGAALDGGTLDRGLVSRLRALVESHLSDPVFASALHRLLVHWWTVEAHCGLRWQYSMMRPQRMVHRSACGWRRSKTKTGCLICSANRRHDAILAIGSSQRRGAPRLDAADSGGSASGCLIVEADRVSVGQCGSIA